MTLVFLKRSHVVGLGLGCTTKGMYVLSQAKLMRFNKRITITNLQIYDWVYD
jgi:hypothetical protein